MIVFVVIEAPVVFLANNSEGGVLYLLLVFMFTAYNFWEENYTTT